MVYQILHRLDMSCNAVGYLCFLAFASDVDMSYNVVGYLCFLAFACDVEMNCNAVGYLRCSCDVNMSCNAVGYLCFLAFTCDVDMSCNAVGYLCFLAFACDVDMSCNAIGYLCFLAFACDVDMSCNAVGYLYFLAFACDVLGNELKNTPTRRRPKPEEALPESHVCLSSTPPSHDAGKISSDENGVDSNPKRKSNYDFVLQSSVVILFTKGLWHYIWTCSGILSASGGNGFAGFAGGRISVNVFSRCDDQTFFAHVFFVLSAVYRETKFAWIGQDILVGTVLLGCDFLYDIFWVFLSKKLFHESVMIVVACGDKSDVVAL
nr:signal peptide peptidase-like 2 [Tanacetum cinerariifolium]